MWTDIRMVGSHQPDGVVKALLLLKPSHAQGALVVIVQLFKRLAEEGLGPLHCGYVPGQERSNDRNDGTDNRQEKTRENRREENKRRVEKLNVLRGIIYLIAQFIQHFLVRGVLVLSTHLAHLCLQFCNITPSRPLTSHTRGNTTWPPPLTFHVPSSVC